MDDATTKLVTTAEYRAQASTPGPMRLVDPPVDEGMPSIYSDGDDPRFREFAVCSLGGIRWEADAEFFMYARDDVLALVAKVREQDAQIERLKRVLTAEQISYLRHSP